MSAPGEREGSSPQGSRGRPRASGAFPTTRFLTGPAELAGVAAQHGPDPDLSPDLGPDVDPGPDPDTGPGRRSGPPSAAAAVAMATPRGPRRHLAFFPRRRFATAGAAISRREGGEEGEIESSRSEIKFKKKGILNK